MSELRITAPESADGAELISLRKWLVDSGDLRGVPLTAHRAEAEPGSMTGTGAVDALIAVLTDRATLTAAVTAVGGWLTARRSMHRTRLRIRHGDREVEVDTARVRDLDELAAWMREQLDDDGPSIES